MKKQQISSLSSLGSNELRSLKEIKNICEELAELQPKNFNEIESKKHIELEYQAFAFEQQRKLAEAAEAFSETILLKKKLNLGKKIVRKNTDRKAPKRRMFDHVKLGVIFFGD